MKHNYQVIPEVKNLGRNLRYLRGEKKIQVFSEEIQYNRLSLSKVEYGIQNIRIKTVIKIAKILNKDVGMLFDISFVDDKEICQSRAYKDIDYMSMFRARVNEFIRINEYPISKINPDKREKISRLLNGNNNNPTVETLAEISSVIGVPLSKLLCAEGGNEK